VCEGAVEPAPVEEAEVRDVSFALIDRERRNILQRRGGGLKTGAREEEAAEELRLAVEERERVQARAVAEVDMVCEQIGVVVVLQV